MGVGEEGAGRGLLRGDEPLGCPWLQLALLTISEGWAEAERGPCQDAHFPLRKASLSSEAWQIPLRVLANSIENWSVFHGEWKQIPFTIFANSLGI